MPGRAAYTTMAIVNEVNLIENDNLETANRIVANSSVHECVGLREESFQLDSLTYGPLGKG